MNPKLMADMFDAAAFTALAPAMALVIGVVLILLAEILPGLASTRRFVFLASITAAAVYEIFLLRDAPGLVIGSSYLATGATAVWGLIFLASTLVAWIFSLNYYRAEKPFQAEHDVLMLCSCIGMMLMAGAQDLVLFFIGLELLSVPLYCLAAFRRARNDSVEAGLKYFMLGAFASALFLYGAGLIYAGTGAIDFETLRTTGVDSSLAMFGVALLFASLFFKASVFPFHLWVPDVYQGSPTPITAFMATGTKAAAFAFLLNASFLLPRSAVVVVAVIAVVTMAIGNLAALAQSHLKRMLAYSGVAHAGTLLLLVVAQVAGDTDPDGALRSGLYYMAAYVFTAGGAFGLLALLESGGERYTTVESLNGLSQRRPGIAAAMTIFMLSLGGIPATGGFLGKYFVFATLVRADLVGLAVVAVLLSVVALGYYLRIVVAMYMKPASEDSAPIASFTSATLGTVLCVTMVLLLGMFPGLFLR